MKKFVLFCFLIGYCCLGSAQSPVEIKWWNPAQHSFPVIEGQAWSGATAAPYDRLPAKAQKLVRPAVWNLSRHATGLMIRFITDATEINVRYGVAGNHAMPHMPATGVSGVDLYAIDSDGQWMWCRGQRSFEDTVSYRFTGLRPHDKYHRVGREYRLYLPLYNQVEWLEIGVAADAGFSPLPLRPEKPIVVYGTSIAHGACASRPGMSWTNILGRKLDRPLINLAFSGNGRLESELIDMIRTIEARVYVLDCLPNLWRAETYNEQELTRRILSSVRELKTHRPEVPVLLVAHAGYTDGLIAPERLAAYTRVNDIQKKAFAQLKKEGVAGLYYLSHEEIGLQLDDMVDGTHPNDLGMMHYAEAYEKKLRSILHEPTGMASTARPCTQFREPDNYLWEDRHRKILKLNETDPPKTVILANSIIHFWGGLPRAQLVREEGSWEKHFIPLGVRNLAYGWDRIENVLWRVYHGELDGYQAERVIVMIGTNNLHLNSDEEILEGLDLLVKAIKMRQPGAALRLMGLLPRRNYEERIEQLNLAIAQLAAKENIQYGNMGSIFLQPDQKIDESLFSDGLHPNEGGYLKMREALLPLLRD